MSFIKKFLFKVPINNVKHLFKAELHQSRNVLGLGEFFENSQALPPFDARDKKIYGRSWSANELRLKSFEDLHKLWFVLLKELNLLSTQKSEANRIGQRWFGTARVHKVRYSPFSLIRVILIILSWLLLVPTFHGQDKDCINRKTNTSSKGH